MPAVGVDVAGMTDLDELTPPGIGTSPGVFRGSKGIIVTRDDQTWKRDPRKRERVKPIGGCWKRRRMRVRHGHEKRAPDFPS